MALKKLFKATLKMLTTAHCWQQAGPLTRIPDSLVAEIELADRVAWGMVRVNGNGGYEAGSSPQLELGIAIGQVREDASGFRRNCRQPDGTPLPRFWNGLAALVSRYSTLSTSTVELRRMQADFLTRANRSRCVVKPLTGSKFMATDEEKAMVRKLFDRSKGRLTAPDIAERMRLDGHPLPTNAVAAIIGRHRKGGRK